MVYEGIRREFGDDLAFIDVEKINPGRDFEAVIRETIKSCDVVLAIIGEAWLTAMDETGARRLDAADDLLRMEIASAMEFNILVIPVLVHGVAPPPVERLPLGLQSLARRNAISLRHESWNSDFARLVECLEKETGLRQVERDDGVGAKRRESKSKPSQHHGVVTWVRRVLEVGVVLYSPIFVNTFELMDPPYWSLMLTLTLVFGGLEVLLWSHKTRNGLDKND